MTWSFASAGTLYVGRGSVESKLPDLCRQAGYRRAFVVTDANLVRAGLVARVTAALAAGGADPVVFDGVTVEPAIEVIRAALSAARGVRPDVVVGLGGGSNMDAAKLVALGLVHPLDPAEYAGDCLVPGPVAPLLCLPTTAGTGSEVSAAAVFTDTAKKMKVSCLSPYLRPLAAVVDPSLTDGCPAKVTADSGIDALTHAVEAFTAADAAEFDARPPGGPSVYQGRNPLSDSMAVQCIARVGQFLRRAVADGTDTEARDGMALAGTLGGLAFANAGVALVHAMEYPVGGAVHVSHGAGNGLLLPYVMRFNAGLRPREMVHVGRALGLTSQSSHPAADVDAAIGVVEQLRADIGIPTRLRNIGVTEEMLPGFADRAFAIKRLMRVNPRVPESAADILAIYKAAF